MQRGKLIVQSLDRSPDVLLHGFLRDHLRRPCSPHQDSSARASALSVILPDGPNEIKFIRVSPIAQNIAFVVPIGGVASRESRRKGFESRLRLADDGYSNREEQEEGRETNRSSDSEVHRAENRRYPERKISSLGGAADKSPARLARSRALHLALKCRSTACNRDETKERDLMTDIARLR